MHRTSGRILLLVAAFALFLVPAAAIAAGGFTDVEDDSVFIADIQWMKDNGVTAGCNPPTNDKYCPKNNVTREQMSAFMHRLAVNQIVDAATAIEADHATAADTATNADKVDGYNASEIVAAYAWQDGTPVGDITTTVEVFSETVTTPVAGVLVVNASLRMADDISLPGAGTATVTLAVDGTTIARGSSAFGVFGDSAFFNTISLSSGVEIPAGTSEITISVSGGSGVFLYDHSANAIFTPFGSVAGVLGGGGDASSNEQS